MLVCDGRRVILNLSRAAISRGEAAMTINLGQVLEKIAEVSGRHRRWLMLVYGCDSEASDVGTSYELEA